MIRKTLSFSGLTKNVLGPVFSEIAAKEQDTGTLPLSDCLMSAFAMFSLKYSSLLKFDIDSRGGDQTLVHNLKNIYGIQRVPSDTTMRERLDPIAPRLLEKTFKKTIF